MQQAPAAPAARMRFFVGKLEERNGEYEYKHVFRFQLAPRRKPEVFLRNLASQFYGSSADRSGETFYFNGGEVAVRPAGCKEVSEAAFAELDGILTRMA